MQSKGKNLKGSFLLIVGWLAILLVIILITPKFGWSAAILLQKASVKIADIIKPA